MADVTAGALSGDLEIPDFLSPFFTPNTYSSGDLMATRASLFLTFLLYAVPFDRESAVQFIVWNVGQGLWTTGVTADHCVHFDMGGERAPWNQVMKLCRKKANAVHLSHWDTDHLSFMGTGRYFLPRLCRLNEPPFPKSEAKQKMFRRIGPCRFPLTGGTTWRPQDRSNSNGQSVVAEWRKVLIPGDSSASQEKIWAHELKRVQSVRFLVLGHHGSQTSTSNRLLEKLPAIRLAIASARKQRYGHPHRRVLDRLKKFGVPVLSTEDWGSIHLWL